MVGGDGPSKKRKQKTRPELNKKKMIKKKKMKMMISNGSRNNRNLKAIVKETSL